MCTLDDMETYASYFGYVEEDFQRLKSKISWNRFKPDDVTKEKKISNCISEMVYTIDEMLDDGFDIAILKKLKLKHMKKSLKRNVQDIESSSPIVKRSKNGSALFLETCYLSDSKDFWFIDSSAINHVCNSLYGFRKTRSLCEGELNLRLGMEASVSVVAVGGIKIYFKHSKFFVL